MKFPHCTIHHVHIALLLVVAGTVSTAQAQARKDEGSQGIIINAQPLPPEKPKAEEPKVLKKSKKRKPPEHFTAAAPKEKPAKPVKPVKPAKSKKADT